MCPLLKTVNISNHCTVNVSLFTFSVGSPLAVGIERVCFSPDAFK